MQTNSIRPSGKCHGFIETQGRLSLIRAAQKTGRPIEAKDSSTKPRLYVYSLFGKTEAHCAFWLRAGLIKRDLPSDDPSHLKIDYRLAPVSRYAFWDIYSIATQNGPTGESNLAEAFANKIVFVGYTFRVEDEHTIPVSSNIVSGQNRPSDRIHGIYIHALGAKTLLSGKLLKDVPAWDAWTPAAGLALA